MEQQQPAQRSHSNQDFDTESIVWENMTDHNEEHHNTDHPNQVDTDIIEMDDTDKQDTDLALLAFDSIKQQHPATLINDPAIKVPRRWYQHLHATDAAKEVVAEYSIQTQRELIHYLHMNAPHLLEHIQGLSASSRNDMHTMKQSHGNALGPESHQDPNATYQ